MSATVLLLLSLVATNMSSTLRHWTSLLLRFVECFNQYLALQTFESRIKQNKHINSETKLAAWIYT